jgi:hypothetical protein
MSVACQQMGTRLSPDIQYHRLDVETIMHNIGDHVPACRLRIRNAHAVLTLARVCILCASPLLSIGNLCDNECCDSLV